MSDGTAAGQQPPEMFQVVMHEVMRPAFERWLAGRDAHLFPIPQEDPDLPTYGVGIGARPARDAAGERGQP